MPMRPRIRTIYIILHRISGPILSEDNGSSEKDRCGGLMFRIKALADEDPSSWTAKEQAAIAKLDAMGAVFEANIGIPSNLASLNDDLEDAEDDAGL